MKNIKPLVIGVTLYLFFFAMMPPLGADYLFVYILFLIGNVLTVYMVYAVLKYGEEPEEKFEDGHWYSDVKKRYTLPEDQQD